MLHLSEWTLACLEPICDETNNSLNGGLFEYSNRCSKKAPGIWALLHHSVFSACCLLEVRGEIRLEVVRLVRGGRLFTLQCLRKHLNTSSYTNNYRTVRKLSSKRGNMLSEGQRANFLLKNSFFSRSFLVVSIVLTRAHTVQRARNTGCFFLFPHFSTVHWEFAIWY